MSVLSDAQILQSFKANDIVIYPFVAQNLNTSSYDVTLGKYFFREQPPDPAQPIFNPYSANDVARVWGRQACEARTLREHNTTAENFSPETRVIFIGPGETILAHTNEFIGGKVSADNTKAITTMMKARSSMGRSFIEVCKCAGWGDVGYTNRWTMEITNNSRFNTVMLIVDQPIAQIVFFQTGPLLTKHETYVESSGKYQNTHDLEKLQKNWKPSDMLPKLYKDAKKQ